MDHIRYEELVRTYWNDYKVTGSMLEYTYFIILCMDFEFRKWNGIKVLKRSIREWKQLRKANSPATFGKTHRVIRNIYLSASRKSDC